jgi:hypothetical protein
MVSGAQIRIGLRNTCVFFRKGNAELQLTAEALECEIVIAHCSKKI